MTREMNIVIVGGGIIGAAIAEALAGRARVTLIEAGQPGQGASAASFGWINASFFLSEEHFELRRKSIETYRVLGLEGPAWTGALSWEASPADLEAQCRTLTELGYPARLITKAQALALEPNLHDLPETLLEFEIEGAVDATAYVDALLDRARGKGAQIWTGCPVERLIYEGPRVIGVDTAMGQLDADMVIVAAGVATERLLPMDVDLKPRPALILQTKAQPPLITRVMVSPGGEFRQLKDGRIFMPLSVNHQADETSTIEGRPDQLAERAMERLRRHLPQIEGGWAQVTAANRPVPKDDFPIVGPVADGAYVAVMHSGVTLAPIIGKVVAQEVLGGQMDPLIAPFRPRGGT